MNKLEFKSKYNENKKKGEIDKWSRESLRRKDNLASMKNS